MCVISKAADAPSSCMLSIIFKNRRYSTHLKRFMECGMFQQLKCKRDEQKRIELECRAWGEWELKPEITHISCFLYSIGDYFARLISHNLAKWNFKPALFSLTFNPTIFHFHNRKSWNLSTWRSSQQVTSPFPALTLLIMKTELLDSSNCLLSVEVTGYMSNSILNWICSPEASI